MRMLRILTAAAALAALAAPVSAQQHPNPKEPPQKTSPSQQNSKGKSSVTEGDTARNFAVFAAHGNLAEVELAKVALDHSSNQDVKQFAQRMVQDHSKAEAELEPIAKQNGITLPTAPDATHLALKTKLEGLHGAGFDTAYMNAMVDDHNRTVAAFQQEASGGAVPALKGYAATTLQTLQEHLQMARRVDAAVRASSGKDQSRP